MKPLRLRVSGYSRFPECDLELPTGTVALVGGNGAGKSRLLNAAELALYAAGSADLEQWLSPWTDRLELELVFEHHGETYRVRRGYRKSSSGTGTATLDLEIAHTDLGPYASTNWTPLTRENVKATQAFLVETLGLSRRAFRASSFLAQDDAGAFTEASAADRRAVLGEVCDPRGRWARRASVVHDRARLVEAEIVAGRARAADREEQAARLPELRDASAVLERQELTARAELAEAERFLELAQATVNANTAAAERVTAARVKVAAAVTAANAAEDALKQAVLAEYQVPGARDHLKQLRARATVIPELEASLDEQRRQIAEAEALRERKQTAVDRERHLARAHADAVTTMENAEAHRDTVAARLEHLRSAVDETERCTVCDQILGTEARAAAITATEREHEAAVRMAEERRAIAWAAKRATEDAMEAVAAIALPDPTPVADIEEPLRQAREAASGLPQAEHNLATLQARADEVAARKAEALTASTELRDAQDELDIASDGIADQTELEQAAGRARTAVTSRRTAVEAAADQRARAAERVAAAELAETDLVAIHSHAEQAQQQLDLLRLAERAYGRDGIPVLLTENVIPLIESEANRILQQMPTEDGVSFSVELHTQRAQKTDASKTTETLDILVNDPDTTRAYESFSGGEQARLNIALRIALARLLAGRRGAESRLLAIDEIPYLDVLGQGQLVDVIRGVAGDFDTTIVVSHHEILRDSFDTVIEIVKRDGVSEIAGAREPEQAAVAA